MNKHRYVLEPYIKLELDKSRSRVKHCPCNKSNKDGKFAPFKGYYDKGYCHSCGFWFNAAAHTCSNCKTEHSFSRYIDTDNANAYIDNYVGKCLSCNYHYTPKQYFEQNKEVRNKRKAETSKVHLTSQPTPKRVSFISLDPFQETLKNYEANHFIKFLVGLFGADVASKLIGKYFIGSSDHWPGSTIFWQIDSKGKIRTGKIMLYSPITGKRVKEPYNHINWVHNALKLPDFQLQQCLFGEHLLKDKTKPVAITESEKSAIIASVYLPQFIWLAVGSLSGLTAERCKPLQGRNVTLYPDLNGFEQWQKRAKELSNISFFTVSDLLNRKATETERAKGLDIADFLIRFNYESNADPIKVQNSDIESLIETHTGKEFGRLIIAGIRTKAGLFYDILFNAEGELIDKKDRPETLQKLEAFFTKRFQPAFLNGSPCLLHSYN